MPVAETLAFLGDSRVGVGGGKMALIKTLTNESALFLRLMLMPTKGQVAEKSWKCQRQVQGVSRKRDPGPGWESGGSRRVTRLLP